MFNVIRLRRIARRLPFLVVAMVWPVVAPSFAADSVKVGTQGSISVTEEGYEIKILSVTKEVSQSRTVTACPPSVVSICDQRFSIQSLPWGATTSVFLPEFFVNQEVKMQCQKSNVVKGKFFFKAIGIRDKICELKVCKGGKVNICNAQIDLKDELTVFQSKKVSIPSQYFVESRKNYPHNAEVVCGFENKDVVLQVSKVDGISCNEFPCVPTAFEMCGTKINVPREAELGQTFSVKTERGEPVTVQCAGSLGQRPAYQVIDRSNVQCQ